MIKLLILFLLYLSILALNTYLIMIIWNKVIILKFPSADIRTLTFWDSLAISVFVTALLGQNIKIN